VIFLEKNFSQRRKDHEKGEEIYHGVEVTEYILLSYCQYRPAGGSAAGAPAALPPAGYTVIKYIYCALDLFFDLPYTVPIFDTRRFKCPAEEKENCAKLPHTNARKNCGKTDTRINREKGLRQNVRNLYVLVIRFVCERLPRSLVPDSFKLGYI